MKNIFNSLSKLYLLSMFSFVILILFLNFQQKTNLPSFNRAPNYSHATTMIAKNSTPIIPWEKLQYHPVYENNSPSFQLVQGSKNKSKRSKILRHILNNEQKRQKFEYVVKKATELKLPAELALIPIIESEYNAKAVSNKGAGGIWQLMPGTARIFGVSSKQRFEMKTSTRAALLYFRDLYRKFGNWEFAIAAYNAGDGRVSKALRRNSRAKSVRELKLPRETRNYVTAFYQLKKELKFSNAKTIGSGTA